MTARTVVQLLRTSSTNLTHADAPRVNPLACIFCRVLIGSRLARLLWAGSGRSLTLVGASAVLSLVGAKP